MQWVLGVCNGLICLGATGAKALFDNKGSNQIYPIRKGSNQYQIYPIHVFFKYCWLWYTILSWTFYVFVNNINIPAATSTPFLGLTLKYNQSVIHV